MSDRTKIDLRCALDVAQKINGGGGNVKGYLVSMDNGFRFIQTRQAWGKRPRVHLYTTAVPELAELVSGVRLHDDEIVRLAFNPIHMAASQEIKGELMSLAKAGVDLRGERLSRLHWDIQNSFQDVFLNHNSKINDANTPGTEKLQSSMEIANRAMALGYNLEPELANIFRQYNQIRSKAELSESILNEIVESTDISKKAKRRVNQIIRQMSEDAGSEAGEFSE